MKKALLIPWTNLNTGERGYVWQTINEVDLTSDFSTIEEALNNSPKGYILLDDGYNLIKLKGAEPKCQSIL